MVPTIFSHSKRLLLILPVLALAGCGTASIEEAVPGARNTGTYPNLNIPQQAETEQLTDEEAASRLAALQTRRDNQNAQPDSQSSEVERLRLLKQKHAEEALEAIEN